MTTEQQTIAPEEHSRLVGGSSAGMRIACPGSYQMEQRLPPTTKDESSTYADEGSALHAAMAHLIENDIGDAYEVLGEEFGDPPYVMTDDLVEDCLVPALAHFDAVLDEFEAVDWVVEKRVELPGIPDAFGTCDLIIKCEKCTIILDWKFGVGVPVKAIYPDDELGDLLNPQLMFYARAAMFTHPELFGKDDDWPVWIMIAQPRGRVDEDKLEDRYTRAETSRKELEAYRMELVARIAEATGKDPRIVRGEHCRFARCKSICPKWTGPQLDLAKLHDAHAARKATPLGDVFDYGELYAAGLDLLELFEPWAKEFRTQAHDFMEQGGIVPGYKLVQKRATRSWKDEKDAYDTFDKAGLSDDDLYERKFRSPAQMEKVLKKLGETLPEELVAKVSSGTTVAPDEDRRKAVIPIGVVVENFAEKLALVAPKKEEQNG